MKENGFTPKQSEHVTKAFSHCKPGEIYSDRQLFQGGRTQLIRSLGVQTHGEFVRLISEALCLEPINLPKTRFQRKIVDDQTCYQCPFVNGCVIAEKRREAELKEAKKEGRTIEF